jgi:hypothetical protein
MSKEMKTIDTRSLFMDITDSLISLLKTLSPEDWNAKTCYPNWNVKNIAAHLVQSGIGRLSKQRDSFPTGEKPKTLEFNSLVNFIAQSNDNWSRMFEGISPQVILDILTVTEKQLADYILSLELMDEAFYSVAWAGEIKSVNCFDIAREYTERWHHQQQIREAVSATSITLPQYLSPVINTLILAIPYWYETIKARTGTRICIEITGDSGGKWVLEKSNDRWNLSVLVAETFDEKISLSEDTAWRFFMRSITKEEGAELIDFSSESELCKNFLDVKAILMRD